MKRKISILIALLSSVTSELSFAGSATWKSSPATGSWTSAANWAPATIPNGPSDIATFATSSVTGVTLNADDEVNSIVFASNASAYVISVNATANSYSSLFIVGSGITNSSANNQQFVLGVDPTGTAGAIIVTGVAAVVGNVSFTTNASTTGGAPAYISFQDTASAGSATYTQEGANTGAASSGGRVIFIGTSTADTATIACNGSEVTNAFEAMALFYDFSTAANANITANGASSSTGRGGLVFFSGGSHAGNATLIASSTQSGLAAGMIQFYGQTTGDTARVELFGTGTLDVHGHDVPGVTIGSLEGEGAVVLGENTLTVGTNSLKTIFSGNISGNGGLTKTGKGNLTLGGANTYTGTTVVAQGGLFVGNTAGSGTGTGAVKVRAGSLGGTGTIAGRVFVGKGYGRGAVLSPGRQSNLGTLTVQNVLTFRNDGVYDWAVNSNRVAADEVIAKGVLISDGILSMVDNGATALPSGTSFTLISNTDATAISGTFINLPDGSTVTIGANTFQANYEGGDGNDLTLTVVP